MPIYDYRCDHCGHVFSAVQSFKDEALEKCPNCAKKPRRLISTPAIVFKGSGWYKTDSRPGQKASESSGGGPDGKSETKTDTKSDTKADTKGETKSDAKGEGKSEGKSERKSETKAPDKPSPKSDAAS